MLALVLALGALFAIYAPTAQSIVGIWWRSETFAHGFLIVPISLFLIWRIRGDLGRYTPAPDLRLGFILLALGAGWFMGAITDVQVVQQLAFVLSIPTLVALILGVPLAWAMAFPLAYLFFAVPIGEGLVPPLMDFTAVFVVKALRLTGIPVYAEGLFFSIPSGDWSVVEGCSGVRYLIASVALGCLYAYLTYRSLGRRLIFIAISALVPIVANGMRAYMIVMIAHLSDMKLALGVDHFIYGWVFFGLVMLLLFWIGSFWREDIPEADANTGEHSFVSTRPTNSARWLAALATALLLLALGPAAAFWVEHRADGGHAVALNAPRTLGSWRLIEATDADWTPRYQGMDADAQWEYTDGARRVGVYVAYYGSSSQGRELINSQNVMVVQKDPVWRGVGRSRETVGGAAPVREVHQSKLRAHGRNLLTWDWYWIGGRNMTSPYLGKLYEALNKLFDTPGSAGIVLYTEFGETTDAAVQALGEFLDESYAELDAELRRIRDLTR